MKKLFAGMLPLLCAFILIASTTFAVQTSPALGTRGQALILIPIKDVISHNKDLTSSKTMNGHSNNVKSVSFSPDGKTLASGSDDNSVILWDAWTGAQLKTLNGHSSVVRSVSFSPDGKTLASGSDDKSVILWDAWTGAQLKTLKGHSSWVDSVSFSPDGKTLASGSEDMSVILWDAWTGAQLKTLKGHSSGVRSVSFSPDGKTLASGSYDKSVILWDVSTGAQLKTLKGHSRSVYSVSFSPDGETLASGSVDESVILWDVSTGAQIKTLKGHSDYVSSVSFSPDGKTLASGNNDKSVILTPTGLKGLAEEGLANFKKDEFETIKEYEARVGKIELPYSATIVFGKYDADRNGFEAEFKGNKLFIPVAKEKARVISGKKAGMRVEGKLKYYDEENMSLVEANVIDSVSNERFALYKMTEGAAIASAPKPATAPQAAYAAVPPLTGYAPVPVVSEIDAIPNFKAAPRPNDIAVVIGIENYQTIPRSDFSKSDAVLVKGYLKAMGFQERNIGVLIDEQATYTGIKKTIESWLPNRVKEDSMVFIYYSGHGAPETKTGDAYLVPFDGDPNYLSDTAYPIKRLYEKLGGLKAAEVIVALDSCFSGAGGRSVLAKGARPLVMMVDAARPPSNMAILTATNGPQISTSSPERGHGVFTYYFLKAIKDGKRNIGEIYEYIKPLVEDEARLLNVTQSPGINPAPDTIKGRFSLK